MTREGQMRMGQWTKHRGEWYSKMATERTQTSRRERKMEKAKENGRAHSSRVHTAIEIKK